MKKSFSFPFSLAVGVTALSVAGCATFRPMPTHAGGKRFDEEQRVLTATVYHAAGKMDFSRFKKRKIALEVTSLETTGATQEPEFPGILHSIPIPITQYLQVDYRLTSKLDVKSMITRQDVEYLRTVIEKRLHFDGYQVTSPEDADIYLVVLVDSLGTNYNRDDYLVIYKDNIEISCELTFYAVDAKTQKMLVPAAAVASSGNYSETNYRPLPFRSHDRNVGDFTTTIVPLPVSFQHSFSGDIGLAPVSDIQTQVIGQKEKKKKKKGGKKNRTPRRKNNTPLPDANDMDSPNSDLLPDLQGQDTGAKPSNDVDQIKLQKLIKRAQKRIDGNDLDGAKKVIKQIQRLAPNSPELPKLEKQLKETETKSSEKPTE